jgi:UDP-N-acetylglucosamine acyltransferase
VAGNPVKPYGLNSVGLERRGASEDVRRTLKQTYQVLFQSKLTLTRAVDLAEDEVEQIPEVRHLLTFIRSSKRGVTT